MGGVKTPGGGGWLDGWSCVDCVRQWVEVGGSMSGVKRGWGSAGTGLRWVDRWVELKPRVGWTWVELWVELGGVRIDGRMRETPARPARDARETRGPVFRAVGSSPYVTTVLLSRVPRAERLPTGRRPPHQNASTKMSVSDETDPTCCKPSPIGPSAACLGSKTGNMGVGAVHEGERPQVPGQHLRLDTCYSHEHKYSQLSPARRQYGAVLRPHTN